MSCCCLNEEKLYCSFVFIYLHTHAHTHIKEIQLSPGLYVSFSLRCMLPYIFLFHFLHWIIFINGFNTQSFNKYQQCWNELFPILMCFARKHEVASVPAPYEWHLYFSLLCTYSHNCDTVLAFFQSVTRLVQKDSEGPLWTFL